FSRSFPRRRESSTKLRRALMRSGSPLPRRRAVNIVTESLRSHHIFPAQEWRGNERDQPIGSFADNREGDDGGDDFGWLAELLAVDQQITETLGGAHELG